jgi:hypothetical protein
MAVAALVVEFVYAVPGPEKIGTRECANAVVAI